MTFEAKRRMRDKLFVLQGQLANVTEALTELETQCNEDMQAQERANERARFTESYSRMSGLKAGFSVALSSLRHAHEMLDQNERSLKPASYRSIDYSGLAKEVWATLTDTEKLKIHTGEGFYEILERYSQPGLDVSKLGLALIELAEAIRLS